MKMHKEVESQLREGGGDPSGADSCAARLMALHMGTDACVGGPCGDTTTATPSCSNPSNSIPCNESSTCQDLGSFVSTVCPGSNDRQDEVQRSTDPVPEQGQSPARGNDATGQGTESDEDDDRVKGKMERKDTFSKEQEEGSGDEKQISQDR